MDAAWKEEEEWTSKVFTQEGLALEKEHCDGSRTVARFSSAGITSPPPSSDIVFTTTTLSISHCSYHSVGFGQTRHVAPEGGGRRQRNTRAELRSVNHGSHAPVITIPDASTQVTAVHCIYHTSSQTELQSVPCKIPREEPLRILLPFRPRIYLPRLIRLPRRSHSTPLMMLPHPLSQLDQSV